MKNVLELNSNEARKYMLQGSQYCTFRLPEYFVFDQLFSHIEKKIGARDEYQCYAQIIVDGKTKKIMPSNYDRINHLLFSNKDGKLDYRPLMLVNPFYYYLLVREITRPNAWKEIIERFDTLRDSHISVESIPVVDDANKDKKTIIGWWANVEQRSLELSLQYKYMFVTDITDCYGTIYTHAIAWAMMGVPKAKEEKGNKAFLGNRLDAAIQGMQYGQTNGIPQGNVVSDLIAELVLAFADSLIVEKAKEKNITDYHIIRYRDDYRVFCNDKNLLEDLALVMQKVLAMFNFKINSAKTSVEEDLVLGSLKKDKIAVFNQYLHRKDLDVESLNKDKSLLQKELLAIYIFSKQYPNSGSVERMLGDVYDWFNASGVNKCNWTVLSSILVSIAKDNPRTYGIVAAIISLFVEKMEVNEKAGLIKSVYEKISSWPNSSLLMIWLQRITLTIDKSFVFDDEICRAVSGEAVDLWNNDWLDNALLMGFSNKLFISDNVINDMKTSIEKDIVSPFSTCVSEDVKVVDD